MKYSVHAWKTIRCAVARLGDLARAPDPIRKLPAMLALVGLVPVPLHAQSASATGPARSRGATPRIAAPRPDIHGLSATLLERSGRLVVTGSDFGTSQAGSQVAIDGRAAIVTSWTDSEIHGYVPEQASLGPVEVQVRTAGGWSNRVSLGVTMRQPAGQVRWRFQMDSNFPGRYLATAADGTVYATDNLRMYALSPDGGLLWVQSVAGGGLPVSVAADGTIYTWRGGMVAIDPSGALKWFYPSDAVSNKMIAGPNLGPDGNLYGVQEVPQGGLGVFSIDPAGQLRWSNTSLAYDDSGGAFNSEIAFALLSDDRFAFGTSLSNPGSVPQLHAYSLDGQLQWEIGSPCNSFPASDPAGHFVLGGTSALCGVTALDRDGNVAWNAPPSQALSLRTPAVASNGTVYTADPFQGPLWAVWPDGTTKWFVDPPGWIQNLGVSPDDAVLVAGGYSGQGQDGSIRAFETTDGSLRWLVSLPAEQGFTQFNWSARPSFAADSSSAYVTTRFTGSGPGYSYVYAVSTSTL